MEEELADAALKLPRAAFVAGRPRWYLILPVEHAEEPSVQFRTLTRDSIKSLAPHGDDHHDAEPPSLKSPRWNRSPWIPQPLVKREGSPFSERISIGRAPNVDIVIRSPFVSKLHAHFVLRPDNADPALIVAGIEILRVCLRSYIKVLAGAFFEAVSLSRFNSARRYRVLRAPAEVFAAPSAAAGVTPMRDDVDDALDRHGAAS